MSIADAPATDRHSPDRRQLVAELVHRLRATRPRVLVVGDLILDGWWNGHTERLSREAPAPVVEVTERTYSPGGAANAAMNLAALGASADIAGVVGDDEAGTRLVELLEDAGVDASRVQRAPGVRTTTKTRVASNLQVLVRIDDGHRGGYPQGVLDDLAASLPDTVDAELICDYGFGALGGPVRARLGRPDRRRDHLVVVDAHDLAAWAGLRADIVTPNAAETARALGGATLDGDRVAAVVSHGRDILLATGAACAVVTLDRDGTVLLRPDAPPYRTHAHPALETHASGAGDTFAAALTLARSAGATLETAADFAQIAADVVVQRFGTSVCTLDDVDEQLGAPSDLALDHDELEARLREHRAAGRRIVFTNGCFDVLHRGHTTYLAQASKLGDVLVVAINGDDSVRRLKGADRPVNRASDRANVLAALGCVDYVTVFDDDTPSGLLDRVRPDVYAKGGDYTPEMLSETAVVRAYGGEVRMLGYVPSQSTTEVVKRIRRTAPDRAD